MSTTEQPTEDTQRPPRVPGREEPPAPAAPAPRSGAMARELVLAVAVPCVIVAALLAWRALRTPDDAASARAALDRARAHERARAPELALVEYARAAGGSPRDASVRRELARMLASRGHHRAALAEYREAASLHADAVTLVDLGLAQLKVGQNEEAVLSFRRATEVSPSSAPAQLDLCIALLRVRRPAEAVPVCRRASELDRKNRNAGHNLGLALRLTGQTEAAIRVLADVLQAEPRRAITLYELGIAFEEAGRRDEARAVLARVLALEPGHEAARRRLEQLGR